MSLNDIDLKKESFSSTKAARIGYHLQRAIYRRGNATHTRRSTIIRRRLSEEDAATFRMEATLSRCLQRRKHAAGRAILPPISNLMAVPKLWKSSHYDVTRGRIPISHQAKSFKSTLPAQAMVFTPWAMLITNSQNIMESVGTLRARQCPGNGIRTSKAARIDAKGINTDMVTVSWVRIRVYQMGGWEDGRMEEGLRGSAVHGVDIVLRWGE